MKRYKSPMSTGYRKPITVYDTDPRAKTKRGLEEYRASIGSEVIVEKAPIDNIVLEDYVAPVEKFMNIYANIAAEGSAFVIDSQNNIYLLSLDYREPEYNKMHFLTKIDRNGKFLWEIRIDDIEDELYEFFNVVGLDIDVNNNIYICLKISNPSPFTMPDLLCIVKINSNGDLIWNKFLNNSNYQNYPTYGGKFKTAQCRVDSDLNIYIIANMFRIGTGSVNDVHQLIIKLNSSGDILWQNMYADSTPGSDGNYYCYGLDIDSSNNLYTISQGASGVLTKYDTSGNILFIKNIDGIGTGPAALTNIVINDDNLYISANRSILDTPSIFDSAVHLLKLDTSANIIWERYIGDQNFISEYFTSTLSSVKNNSIFITIPNYLSIENTSFVIVKMSSDGNYLYQKKVTDPLNVTPSTSGFLSNTIALDIDQNNNKLYCSGLMSVDGNDVSFMFKIPDSSSEQHFVSFTDAIIYDDDYPLDPYSEYRSFDINIENVSLYSPTTSSYLSLSDYTDYSTITDSTFTPSSYNIIFNKTTTPDLNETKGVFA